MTCIVTFVLVQDLNVHGYVLNGQDPSSSVPTPTNISFPKALCVFCENVPKIVPHRYVDWPAAGRVKTDRVRRCIGRLALCPRSKLFVRWALCISSMFKWSIIFNYIGVVFVLIGQVHFQYIHLHFVCKMTTWWYVAVWYVFSYYSTRGLVRARTQSRFFPPKTKLERTFLKTKLIRSN